VTPAVRAATAAVLFLAAVPALAAKRPLAAGERIDLNRASVAELMRLPGIGEKRAKAILDRRTRRPFRRPEDVLLVRGLGRAWFGRVKGHLLVGPPPAVGSGPMAAPTRAGGKARGDQWANGRQRIPASTRKASSASSMAAP
jgi:competence protein ComEA